MKRIIRLILLCLMMTTLSSCFYMTGRTEFEQSVTDPKTGVITKVRYLTTHDGVKKNVNLKLDEGLLKSAKIDTSVVTTNPEIVKQNMEGLKQIGESFGKETVKEGIKQTFRSAGYDGDLALSILENVVLDKLKKENEVEE